jgi:ribonuclease III
MQFLKKILKKSRSEQDGLFFNQLKNILGFAPKNLHFYKKSFTHRSANVFDDKGNPFHYERLEFLGDAMLGSVIAAHIYSQVPNGDEGYLTKMRSKIVSREHLNELGKDLNLIQFLNSKVPPKNFGENIHGNLFEAFVGAIYLDQGFSFCEKFIHLKVIEPYVDIAKLEGKVISYKSLIIEWCQKEKKTFQFLNVEDNGQEAHKHFSIQLMLDGKPIAKSRATSKKKAEEKAAKRAYFVFQTQIEKASS